MDHKKISEALRASKIVSLPKKKYDCVELIAKKILLDVIAAKSRSQKGDVSKHLDEQGFFDKGKPRGLDRDPLLSGGNPVDTLDDFLKQNPN